MPIPALKISAIKVVPAVLLTALVGGWGATAQAAPATDGESVKAVTARRLLDGLEERQMPDVALWVLDRLEADPEADAGIKKEIPFRRAAALVGTSRNETDSGKRGAIFDRAEKEIDRFLADSPDGEKAIKAYAQKGNLLVERGRTKVELAKRPGEDVAKLQSEAVTFFDGAIKSLDGAEKAVLELLRDVDGKLSAMKPPSKDEGDGEGKPDPKKKRAPKLSAAQMKEVGQLEEKQDELRGQLLQMRLLIAAALYEKSKALPKDSEEWKKSLKDSSERYGKLYEKYRTRGAGLFARYYEGRNYVALGDRAKALTTLADIRALEGEGGFVPVLRAKAVNASLECWLEDKKYDEFDERLLKIAMASVPVDKLDADWLGLKYRAAALLERRADGLPDKEKVKAAGMLKNAKKLALEVVKANKDFGKESRDLLAQLGRQLPDDADAIGATFEDAMDAAKAAIAAMQAKQGEAKQAEAAGNAADAEAAAKAAAGERDKAVAAIRKAVPLAGDDDLDALNQARYLLTFLLYDSKRLHDSAALGSFLAERYPNSKGSRQAAKIAMASWQQLMKQPADAWRSDAKSQCAGLAELIMRTWPEDAEGGDAALIAIATAIEARDADRMVSIIDKVPAASPRRLDVLLRAGSGLWREVLERRRLDESLRPAEAMLAGWKDRAKAAIDEALKAIPDDAAPARGAVAAALARSQIAIEDGDRTLADKLLEHPSYGPWTVVNGKDPAFAEGSLAESTLSVSLRHFIQSDQLDKAQQAMDRLEAVAGTGEEASAKLTGMYLSMGRDLQSQLEDLGGGEKAGTPETQAKAQAILGGFEKFLDGVAKRDPKVSSQIWVATTYLTLGSGKGTGAIVSKEKAEAYLTKAAEAYENLLKKGGEEIARFEPSIRLKMANVYRERQKWEEAQTHLDWILSDPKRQNSLETQIQAAELSQAAGEKAADKAKAEAYLKQAIVGYKRPAVAGQKGEIVSWGWGGIANKIQRQAFSSSDEKAMKARGQFFTARLNVAKARLARAELGQEREKLLQMAENDIAITYKLYPDLGGESSRRQFDKLLRQIQKERGSGDPRGLKALEEVTATAAGAGG
jgi:hypothetical protein